MKKLSIIIIMVVSMQACLAQNTTSAQRILDSVSQKAIYYLQQKQSDSIYAMAGENFRSHLSHEDFKQISMNQVFPLNDFKNVAFVKTVEGINKYKVDGSPELQLLIGLDKDNKLETFLIQAFSDN